jgi:hypothetical protein
MAPPEGDGEVGLHRAQVAVGDLMPRLKKQPEVNREIERPVLVKAPHEEHGKLP